MINVILRLSILASVIFFGITKTVMALQYQEFSVVTIIIIIIIMIIEKFRYFCSKTMIVGTC